jgi:hypothetical protein
MFLRTALVAVIASVAFSLTAPLQAENPVSSFFHSMVQDYKRRNCWPEPFESHDRCAVEGMLASNIQRGWEVQNMISDYHFEPGTATLTEAGRLKVEWILTEAPAQRRMVFVHKTTTIQDTAARVAAVRQLAAQILPPGGDLPVYESGVAVPTWSADRVDIIARKANTSIPAPVLKSNSASGSGGSSGSSGSGS